MSSMLTKFGAALFAASLWHSAADAQDPYVVQAGSAEITQAHGEVYSPVASPATYAPGAQYPQLHAPLYPGPTQQVPAYAGGTIITNQAFAPHETLYPHTYHAMYPPFYHKVKGAWIWTPFGMRQHEQWKLQGTEVTVKYRSNYPVFGGFHPPRIH